MTKRFIKYNYWTRTKMTATVNNYPSLIFETTLGMKRVSWFKYMTFNMLPVELFISLWGEWDSVR